jgi:hypothetical protein
MPTSSSFIISTDDDNHHHHHKIIERSRKHSIPLDQRANESNHINSRDHRSFVYDRLAAMRYHWVAARDQETSQSHRATTGPSILSSSSFHLHAAILDLKVDHLMHHHAPRYAEFFERMASIRAKHEGSIIMASRETQWTNQVITDHKDEEEENTPITCLDMASTTENHVHRTFPREQTSETTTVAKHEELPSRKHNLSSTLRPRDTEKDGDNDEEEGDLTTTTKRKTRTHPSPQRLSQQTHHMYQEECIREGKVPPAIYSSLSSQTIPSSMRHSRALSLASMDDAMHGLETRSTHTHTDTRGSRLILFGVCPYSQQTNASS